MKAKITTRKGITTIHSKIVMEDIGGGFSICSSNCSFFGFNSLMGHPYCILMGEFLDKKHKGKWIHDCESRVKYFTYDTITGKDIRNKK